MGLVKKLVLPALVPLLLMATWAPTAQAACNGVVVQSCVTVNTSHHGTLDSSQTFWVTITLEGSGSHSINVGGGRGELSFALDSDICSIPTLGGSCSTSTSTTFTDRSRLCYNYVGHTIGTFTATDEGTHCT